MQMGNSLLTKGKEDVPLPVILDIERHIPELVGVPIEQVADNLLSGKYPMEKTDAIIRYIIAGGHCFAPADINRLKTRIPGVRLGASYAHWLALRGYKFSLNELIELKETRDQVGQTVAHYMAKSGQNFPPSEWPGVSLWESPVYGYRVEEATWEYWITMADLAERRRSERFALVFKDGSPVFVQNSLIPSILNRGQGQYSREVIQCLWGHTVHDLGVMPRYFYSICIEKNNTVRVVEADWISPDEYTLVMFMALNHLVERLNGALQSRQDHDFTDVFQALQLLFIEFEFEMNVEWR
jgi:hypothetical protein